MTKIQKESNSQRHPRLTARSCWCCDLWQRYKKKAIHNHFPKLPPQNFGVVTYDKDTKRKQFTTSICSMLSHSGVLWPMTKIQKESNSQLAPARSEKTARCCDLWQRYKKKAIHNSGQNKEHPPWVLWPMTKIQKESNSQRPLLIIFKIARCCDLWQRYKNSWQVRKAPCVVIQACRFCVLRVWGGTSFCTGTDFSVSYLFWSFFIARHPGNRYHCGSNF